MVKGTIKKKNIYIFYLISFICIKRNILTQREVSTDKTFY